jgi:hypothetical protein
MPSVFRRFATSSIGLASLQSAKKKEVHHSSDGGEGTINLVHVVHHRQARVPNGAELLYFAQELEQPQQPDVRRQWSEVAQMEQNRMFFACT